MAKAKGKGKKGRKAPTAKQQANWDRFARESRARAKAKRSTSSSTRSTSTRPAASTDDAAAAKRRRAAKRAAKTRATFRYRATHFVKKNPVKTILVGLTGGAVAYRPTRQAIYRTAARGVAIVRRP